MSLKIIAGTHRGRNIQTPEGKETRPTASRVREAIFNIIGPIEGSDFWDLYAGSGAVGIEAKSRGVKNVLMVEMNPKVCKLIESNLRTLEMYKSITVQNKKSEAFVELAMKKGMQCDVLFVDPPFVNAYPETEEWIKLVKRGGTMVLQYPSQNSPIFDLTPTKVKVYGESCLAFFDV
jgi:16S rRNA (guanine966-N2)-methyltransferase